MVESPKGVTGASNVNDRTLLKKFNVKVQDDYKSLEEISIHYGMLEKKSLERHDGLRITLSNGTKVELEKQNQKGAKIVKTDDAEYDFEKISNAQITPPLEYKEEKDGVIIGYSNYNLMGCQNTFVDARNGNSENISIGNHQDGTPSKYNTVELDEKDHIWPLSANIDSNSPKAKARYEEHNQNNGELLIDDKYGRKVRITNDNKKEYIAHDGVKLKESYVSATEKKFKDGYSVRTSPDGKEKWYFDPKGKPITPKQFAEAKHPYKIVYKK